MPCGTTTALLAADVGSDAATAADTAMVAASSPAVARQAVRVARRSECHGVCDVVTTLWSLRAGSGDCNPGHDGRQWAVYVHDVVGTGAHQPGQASSGAEADRVGAVEAMDGDTGGLDRRHQPVAVRVDQCHLDVDSVAVKTGGEVGDDPFDATEVEASPADGDHRRVGRFADVGHRRGGEHGGSEFGVDDDELWHPNKLTDSFDDAVILVAPFVLLAAVALVVLTILELLEYAFPVAVALLRRPRTLARRSCRSPRQSLRGVGGLVVRGPRGG